MEGINYLSEIDDCEPFEKNDPRIALNNFYIKEEEILPAQHNSTHEKQVILLTIPSEEEEVFIILL